MKKLTVLALTGVLAAASLAGCKKTETPKTTEAPKTAVTEAAKTTATEAAPVSESVSEAVSEAAADVKEAVSEAISEATADAKEAVSEAVSEATADAKEAVSEAMSEVTADLQEVTSEVTADLEKATSETADTAENTSEADTEETSEAGTEEASEAGTEEASEAGTEEASEAGTEEASEAGTEETSEAGTEEASEAGKEVTPAKELSGKVVVYNWGEYIDPEVLEIFEEETGVKVIYEEFETNEIMYPKVDAGAIAYDVVCPSDYMIDKMIQNDLLYELNFDNIPNVANIDDQYMKWSEEFDPGNKYSVPYCWGTVGILYNKTMVDDPVDSWNILWNEKYADNILMQDSVRDIIMVAEKMLGYSINSVNEDEISAATDLLIEQKPLVQAYVIDQVRDKMIGGEAALGVIYSGEAIFTQRENPDLEYVIPKEGTNVWIDSWVIPKNAANKENAEAFINFLCRADIAKMNFDYITYSTPNKAARELIEDDDIRNSLIAFPTPEMLENSETYKYLGEDADNMYADYWNKLKAY